jgi:hypothetical protein
MQASEFIQRWTNLPDGYGSDLIRLPSDTVAPVSASTLNFLIEAGLPESAVPSLRLDGISEGLKPIYEVYGRPQDWSDDEKQRLSPYLLLGDDEGGNPICIDLPNNERVVWVDHEDYFHASRFINSSVSQLAECVLVFAEFILKYQQEFGEDADVFDGEVPISMIEDLTQQMQRIDPPAIENGAFWFYALKDLYPYSAS